VYEIVKIQLQPPLLGMEQRQYSNARDQKARSEPEFDWALDR
jgi:hypothetical protein